MDCVDEPSVVVAATLLAAEAGGGGGAGADGGVRIAEYAGTRPPKSELLVLVLVAAVWSPATACACACPRRRRLPYAGSISGVWRTASQLACTVLCCTCNKQRR